MPTPTSSPKADKPQHKPQRKPGGWLLALFALPFAGVGVGMLVLGVLPTLYDWGRMQAWQPVPATLEAAALKVSRGSKSTTYGVSASYRYRVAGREYEGERVAVVGGSDNVGDFQEALGQRLEAAHRQGQPVVAWVNPANPAEAVLDRSLRPGLLVFKMVFVLIFGGFGLGMWYGLWRARKGGGALQAAPRQRNGGAGAEAAVHLEQVPGGVRLHLPWGRAWKAALVTGLVGALFLAVALLVDGEEAPLAFVLGFGGLGGLLLVGGFYGLANSLRVELDGRGVRTERRLLGLMLRHHQAPAQDIVRLRVVESHRVQTGTRHQTFYRIEVELRGGKKLTVADHLDGKAAADRLLARIAAQTGYAR